MRLGELIRLYCAARGVSYAELGRQWGCSRAAVCRLAGGKSPTINGRTMARIVAWLIEA